MEYEDLTWRNVLDSDHNFHGHIDYFFQLVLQSGYPYFCWNGRVFKVVENTNFDTGLLVKDIK